MTPAARAVTSATGTWTRPFLPTTPDTAGTPAAGTVRMAGRAAHGTKPGETVMAGFGAARSDDRDGSWGSSDPPVSG